MLNIYANAFRTATRMGPVHSPDKPAADNTSKKAWLPNGHWWVQQKQDLRPATRRPYPDEM